MSGHKGSNITRIATLLEAFDGANTPLPTGVLLSRAGLTRATGFALIRALVAKGWLLRADHGLLQLGPATARLMYSPLEPALAHGTAAPRLMAQPQAQTGPVPEDMPGEMPGDDWQSALTETVDTSGFMRPGPVRIGFSNASLSNPWRAALLASMRYSQRLYADRLEEVLMRSADDDPALQLQQIDELVSAGIDLLIISCTHSAAPAINARLRALAEAGLPIVAVDRRPSDAACLVSFATASDRRIGRICAQWMIERLGFSGRIWMLSGVEGASPAIRRQAAALASFAAHPGITVETVSYTGWTDAGGYRAVDRLLAQGSPPPDGVWCDSGLQGVGSLQRFVETGGPLPIHTGGDLNRMYKLALHHKLPFVAVDYPAAMGGRAIEVALDILAGRPVQRRIEVPAPVVLPRGQETRNIRADIWAETHVGWGLPDDAILSQGPSVRDLAFTADGGGSGD
ncbi:hypothetical protein E2K80_04345 [Rhodophyticola sp. CCM32]|uniref:substrate-binding domain-containing protein n=1 Tax=Rhodophyticola sp. CCM32 TaxID=2916397 RepID=UPI00107F2FC2|nr:substrate-binding domain-containing protein [Rhodophyticola sp. CCM32]QBY00065.1 hypothetical protein E2K80_04345 [Rhodophyticola sp. CCM32]